MKSVTIISVLIIIVLAFSNCQKETIPDNFVIGSNNGVSVKLLEDQFSYSTYGQEEVLWIDVNDDGENDFKFFTYAVDSLGDQDKRGSSVWSTNHDIEFGYQIAYEDLFSVTKESEKGKRKIIYNERSHFYCALCQNLSQKNKRFSFSSPVLLSEGSSLSNGIKWSDKLQILSQLDQSRQFSEEENNIPVYNNIMTGIWDKIELGYIPFRIKISFGKHQYGWIKLQVLDHRRIELFEIGLQDIVF